MLCSVALTPTFPRWHVFAQKEKWEASVARHARWDMSKVYKQFDTDGDGKLSMREFRRAFRALGLKKRDGEDFEVDKAMFESFDTNGSRTSSCAPSWLTFCSATR